MRISAISAITAKLKREERNKYQKKTWAFAWSLNLNHKLVPREVLNWCFCALTLGAKPEPSLKWEEYYVAERGQQEWVQILGKVRCRVPFPGVAQPLAENFFSYSSSKSRNSSFAKERNIGSEPEDLQVMSRKESVSQSCMQTWLPCSQEWITKFAIPDLLNLSWNHTLSGK